MLLPLEPAVTMFRSLLEELRPSRAMFPDLSLASLRVLFTSDSKLWIMSIPGCETNFPWWDLFRMPFTYPLYLSKVFSIPSETAFSSTIMSWTPTVKPLKINQLFTSCWTADKKLAACCAPYSLETMCAMLFPTGPRICFVRIPCKSSPFSIKTLESLGQT